MRCVLMLVIALVTNPLLSADVHTTYTLNCYMRIGKKISYHNV